MIERPLHRKYIDTLSRIELVGVGVQFDSIRLGDGDYLNWNDVKPIIDEANEKITKANVDIAKLKNIINQMESHLPKDINFCGNVITRSMYDDDINKDSIIYGGSDD